MQDRTGLVLEEGCVVVRISSFAEEHGVGPANAPAPLQVIHLGVQESSMAGILFSYCFSLCSVCGGG